MNPDGRDRQKVNRLPGKQDPATSERPVNSQNKEENKQRVLTQGVSSMVRSIADAVVIKHQNLFLLNSTATCLCMASMVWAFITMIAAISMVMKCGWAALVWFR